MAVITTAVVLLGQEKPAPRAGISVGTALDVENLWGVETPLQVGEEIIEMYGFLTNTSDRPVVLREIRPVPGEGIPENGEVVGFFLVKPDFEAALHHALPPVMRRRGRCVTADPMPVQDYVLQPGAEVMVATHFRATRLGTFKTKGRDIIYEQPGRTYRQRDPELFTGMVRPHWKRDDSVERRCREHTMLLPSGAGLGSTGSSPMRPIEYRLAARWLRSLD